MRILISVLALVTSLVPCHAFAAPPFEASLHTGGSYASTTVPSLDISGPQSGFGATIDGDAGWRVTPWLSLRVFAAYAAIHETGTWFDLEHYVKHVTDDYYDVGLHVRFHVGGAFAGFGVGYEGVRESGRYMCSDGAGCAYGAGQVFADRDRRDTVLAEVHAGYTFPKVHGVAPQLMCALDYDTEYDDRIGARVDTIGMRLVLGVQL